MKKLILLLTLIAIIPVGSANGGSFEDQFHEHMLEVGWKQSLIELDRYSTGEQRYILERALLAFGPDSIPRTPERQANFEKAQSTLLSIPGHAKYYQDKIEKMRAELLENSKKTREEIIQMHIDGKKVLDEPNYLSDSEVALRTLKFMPSAETVSVLGHFLNDPVGRDGKSLLGHPLSNPGDDFGPRLSHAEVATEMIRALGIEHPPFRDSKGTITPEEIDAWKDWWNEVKDGKRTYRFIGSKIEYGPDGPATKEVIQHAERDRKRDEEREAGHRKTSTAPETGSAVATVAKPFSLAGILAACALVGGAIWYCLRSRKAA